VACSFLTRGLGLQLGAAWMMTAPLRYLSYTIDTVLPTAALMLMTLLHQGAISMMVVAVITRASLGHTGRPLIASRPIAVAYGLLALAALVRVFGPIALATHYEWTLHASSGLWIAAFALLVMVYAPILVRARIDGRSG
jgi:uncharacterized protein involved in response to NO